MGCKFRLSDLPPSVVAMIRPADRAALGLDGHAVTPVAHKPTDAPQRTTEVKERPRGRKGPNKTEATYRDERLRGLDARYEALTFRMANGHRYTPDWVVFRDGVPVACHEVKGSYRMHSHGRARLAFDQARAEFPGLTWEWTVWNGKVWIRS